MKNKKKLLAYLLILGLSGASVNALISYPQEIEEEHDNDLDYSRINSEGFTPQGYEKIDKFTLISAYSPMKESRLFIFDSLKNDYLGYVVLNNHNHVGGLSYDASLDVLFVTGKDGSVETYNFTRLISPFIASDEYETIVLLDEENSIQIPNNFDVKQQAATLCCHDGSLYSINYGKNGILVQSDYHLANGKLKCCNDAFYILESATCIQGMCFYNNNNKDYLVLSTSYGNLYSRIKIYEVKEDFYWDLVNEAEIPITKMEGISVKENGDITAIFEGSHDHERIIGNVNDILTGYYTTDVFSDLKYDVCGSVWDLGTHNELSLDDAKKLIKTQEKTTK